MSHFRYEPLPDNPAIRILELFPGEDDDPIACLLTNEPLSSCRPYEALSYCWGDPTFSHPIYCNGSSFAITASLHSALRHLRHNDRSRYIWADAICINQSDNKEKEHQVRLMRRIYSQAAQVDIWLGEEADLSGLLDDFVPRLRRAKERQEEAEDDRTLFNMSSEDRKEYNLPNQYDPRNLALLNLERRPWFHRVWIIQETCLASSAFVYCGDWNMPWADMADAMEYIAELGVITAYQVDNSNTEKLLRWTERNIADGTRESLLTLLLRHREAQATNARDKIFALCGLASDAELIDINYGKSTVEVYTEAATNIIRRYNSLDILTAAGLDDNADTDLPTWVPDWSNQNKPVPLLMKRESENDVFPAQCTRSTSCAVPFKDGDRSLNVSGIFLDQVSVAGPTNPLTEPILAKPKPGWQEIADKIEEDAITLDWEQMFMKSDEDYVAGGSVVDAFWQTTCAGALPKGDFDLGKQCFLSWDNMQRYRRRVNSLSLDPKSTFYKLLYIGAGCATSISQHLKSDESDEQKAFWFRLMGCASVGRKMVKTEKGYLALAPAATVEGDWVVLLKGCCLPLLLRPHGGKYLLVGEGYVHGIMKGEAFREEDCLEIKIV